jgi:hypothetical protein
MSDYHHTHWVTFYKCSVFSAPVSIAVNCFIFDALSCLSLDDANLFLCTGRCFMCCTAVHRVAQCSIRGPHVLFCKRLDNPHCEYSASSTGWLECSYIILGWDDDCLGLVEMLKREAEWKERGAHNNAEVAYCKVEAPNGWGNTPPTSPVHEGWPGVPIDANRGTWPLPSEIVPLCPDGWPNLSPPVQDGVRVTIEVKLSIEDSEEHSACRSLMVIGCLSVLDLLSFLCHSTIGTSIRSCALVVPIEELT